MNRPSPTGCFLSRLVNDRLGSEVCLNMQIINDNARGRIQFGAKCKFSNEKQDKALLHIASRWGDSPETKRHDLLRDAQLRPIPRRTVFESKEDTREGVSISCGNDRWSTFESRTERRNDRAKEEDAGSKEAGSKDSCSKGVHSSGLWRYTTLPLSGLPLSENDSHTNHGMKVGRCKHSRVVHLTARAVLISSSSPRLPIRTKSYSKTFSSVNVPTLEFRPSPVLI
jgi:hypothetical protein